MTDYQERVLLGIEDKLQALIDLLEDRLPKQERNGGKTVDHASDKSDDCAVIKRAEA